MCGFVLPIPFYYKEKYSHKVTFVMDRITHAAKRYGN